MSTLLDDYIPTVKIHHTWDVGKSFMKQLWEIYYNAMFDDTSIIWTRVVNRPYVLLSVYINETLAHQLIVDCMENVTLNRLDRYLETNSGFTREIPMNESPYSMNGSVDEYLGRVKQFFNEWSDVAAAQRMY